MLAARDVVDADYRVLDQYAGGIVDEAPRIEAIATISAGAKNEKGFPVRSADGRIFLHDPNGRAPQLAEILASTSGKRLTVAFPFNDPAQFIQQRFAAYSASALRAYGDEHEIVVLEGGRRTVAAGTKEYGEWAKLCKVQASIFFCLSEWDENGMPLVSMPDGLGYYRLRTTSRNSLRSILSTLRYAATFTRGLIAGLPFTLSIEQRDVAMADGKRQRVPVWVAVMQPPGGVHLTSRTFAAIARQALDEGASLFLPAPARETVETAIIEAGTALVVDDELPISDEELAMLANGAPCDPADFCRQWFAMAKGTPFGDKESPSRAQFIAGYCAERGLPLTGSLAAFLKHATVVQALDLIAEASKVIRPGVQSEPGDAFDPSTTPMDPDGPDPETGELELSEDERLAAIIKAELFEGEPESPEAIDPSLTTQAERIREWYQMRIPAQPSRVAAKDVSNFHATRLGEVGGSLVSAIALFRYLSGKPDRTFADLTVAEAALLDKYFKLPKDPGAALAAIVPVAKAWVVAQERGE